MPRARRSEIETARMRAELVTAARAAIAEHGLAGLTARGLAQRLGWSVGTLYSVAPSLEWVGLEANAAELAALDAALEQRGATLAEAAPEERLRAFAQVFLDLADARPRSWAAIFERTSEAEPPDWYRARQTALFARVAEALTPLVEDAAEARRAAATLWAALQGVWALDQAGHLDRVVGEGGFRRHAMHVLDVILAGLAARRGRR